MAKDFLVTVTISIKTNFMTLLLQTIKEYTFADEEDVFMNHICFLKLNLCLEFQLMQRSYNR